jgi:hypothetical protein
VSVTSRLLTGIRIARNSASVLRDHPRLLWFPALAGAAGLTFLALVFGGGMVGLAFLRGPSADAAFWAGLAVAYFGTSFVAVLFTAGLMEAARDVFAGESASVRGGLRGAWQHKRTLLAWAVVSAVVGLVARALQESDNIGAVLVGALLSLSWAVVTYFAVPVAVFEGAGIRGVFDRSTDIVRSTWGESLGAEFGLGFVHALLYLPVLALAAALAATLGPQAAVVVAGPLFVIAFLAATALNGIAKVALYQYATTDEPPRYFENVDFDAGGESESGSSRSLLGRLRGS